MVFTNILTLNTQKYINMSDKEQKVRTSLPAIRAALEELNKLEAGSQPVKMDLSPVQQVAQEEERYTTAEWTAWEQGYWPEAGEEQQEEAAENPGLDAFQQKGNGKGKGQWQNNWGKGKAERARARTRKERAKARAIGSRKRSGRLEKAPGLRGVRAIDVGWLATLRRTARPISSSPRRSLPSRLPQPQLGVARRHLRA